MMIMSCLIVQVCIVPACKRKFVLVRKMLPRNYRAHKAASVHFLSEQSLHLLVDKKGLFCQLCKVNQSTRLTRTLPLLDIS